jgi:hypothetical protein
MVVPLAIVVSGVVWTATALSAAPR